MPSVFESDSRNYQSLGPDFKFVRNNRVKAMTFSLDNRKTTENLDFICSDGFITGVLNDDYCDCPSGEDEPNTSACSHLHSKFICDDGKILFSSRVHDSVVDCIDKTDESFVLK